MTNKAKNQRTSHILNERQKRQTIILEILKDSAGMTAKEIAVILETKGIVPISERNATAPRLTELRALGLVEVTGKKTCDYTGRTVTVWQLKKE